MATPVMDELDLQVYRQELHVHCIRILGSAADAEDAVQDTLLRAWRARDGYRGGASVRTWLHAIATNTCLTALRSRSRRPVLSVPDAPEPAPCAEPPGERIEPEAWTVRRCALRTAIATALGLLPARQWAVLVLRDGFALSAEEVAGVLGTTRAAVNSALQRARQRLAEPGCAAEPADPRLVERFLAALDAADLGAIITLCQELRDRPC
jgi:RNA polymerase sigma-70 factor, ECF subfamily